MFFIYTNILLLNFGLLGAMIMCVYEIRADTETTRVDMCTEISL